MLTSQDLQQIRLIMKEEISENNKVLDDRFNILEEKLEKKFREMLEQGLEQMRIRIILETGEFITTSIIPLIDQKADKKLGDKHEKEIIKMKSAFRLAAD